MKTLLLLLICQLSFAQIRINKTEYFTVSTSIDPTSSIKEKGLDIVLELEYVGLIYAKVGIESFDRLQGSYRDAHGAIGINLTSGNFEKVRYYAGVRGAKVHRGNYGAYRINYGLEAGIDLDIADNCFIGIRSTLDKRHDQEIYRWAAELQPSGFIRLGYKWYYKNKR